MEDRPLIPLRMLNEWTYCERLGVLEWLHGEFEDNADTVEGAWRHRRVDRAGPALEVGEPVPEGFVTRALWLESVDEGLTGKLDVAEEREGMLVPVDTKKGKPAPASEGGVWEPERVQLCAQGLLLRAAGYACEGGYVFFVGARRRVWVAFDEALVARTRALAAGFREAAEAGVLPAPLVDSPKCPRCSLVGICLPDETALLARAVEIEGVEVGGIGGVARQLRAPRGERYPLYVGEQGARVGVSKGELVVSGREGELTRARLGEVAHVALMGNVQVSAQAVGAMGREGVALSWLSYGGWLVGVLQGPWHKNVVLRQAQWAVVGDAGRSLAVAREMVRSKVRNQRTMLRRNGGEAVDDAVLRELKRLAEAARGAADAGALLGLEGAAGRLYWRSFGAMVKGTGADAVSGVWDWEGRSRRPPRDPMNALLGYGYGLLLKDVVAALTAVGFDPYVGVYHRPRYGRPALGLDLMEEFRPLVVDSVVLMAVNNGEVTERSFVRRADGCGLTGAGRRAFVRAYERRMEQVVTHPLFGYRATWRRVLEVQARLLGRHMLGEVARYVPVETR